MKIIFGNTAPPLTLMDLNLDGFFYNYLKKANDDIEKAVEEVLKVFGKTETSLWTCNPLIPNYLDDDVARELIYIYIEGQLIKFGDDEHLCKKLQFMGPGEALADDGRIWPKGETAE
jgi:hypothetical protein